MSAQVRANMLGAGASAQGPRNAYHYTKARIRHHQLKLNSLLNAVDKGPDNYSTSRSYSMNKSTRRGAGDSRNQKNYASPE